MFFSDKGVVTADQFSNDLAAVRGVLGSASHVCNLKQDRFHFSLGLAAALLNNQITILPPSDAPETIIASLEGAESPVILADTNEQARIAPCIDFPPAATLTVDTQETFEALTRSSTEIRVFTSGTTKKPECNVKTWKMLRTGASITDEILRGIDADPDRIALLGTTPPKHMFGLETTIFTALSYGRCTYRDTIFFPADLEKAIEVAREFAFTKLVLVTSPAHLRFLEPAILAAPEICCVLSATAPLLPSQAERLEARRRLKVMEVYGSTETGTLAMRRMTQGEAWTPSAGFRLEQNLQNCVAIAPHLPTPVPLGDEVEIKSDGRFVLLGRTGDMVNIRGKRSRLSSLNAFLAEAPGIIDGVFLHVKKQESDLLAIAVVPYDRGAQSEAELKQAVRRYLMRYIEPSFVPKRILVLDALSRTPTGKLSDEQVNVLAKKAGLVD